MTLSFTPEQRQFIKYNGIPYDFEHETSESRCMLENSIGDIYMWASMEYDDNPDTALLEKMKMCESILDPEG